MHQRAGIPASRHPALNNPTVVVVTDRNDLDDRLYNTFLESQLLLGQTPRHVQTRKELREKLTIVRTGGILFTTLQQLGKTQDEKESGAHHPLLSDRRNIIVIVDEAHRSPTAASPATHGTCGAPCPTPR
ncbi:DEAD/DEAH box helicase family protein [Streptomyces sp. ACA25]|uniref:DEAD/DEAH box helicase family protein n=1 Tax=Streptomyces sp. ACA25 TaxID=3022596 RepID=UPI0023070807|nr:DEAD/DEAH box helicase family protein [Streptomyces sp. ACA25]MDB1088116.1 DEAD/DEAH box helicase family protein [Streptomyces sp. ACA25]